MMKSRVWGIALLGAIACGACGGGGPVGAGARTGPSTSATPVAPVAPPRSLAESDAAALLVLAQKVDALLAAHWKEENVTPAPACDDATFLRRVTIDVTGRIPTAEAARAFLADAAPDKRARMVRELMASPDYATHWMNYWDDVLMGRVARGGLVDRVAFRAWLRGRFAENAPWNRVVVALVAAQGVNTSGGVKRGQLEMPMTDLVGEELEGEEAGINGAVNYPLRFADAPQDLAGSESRNFLGVQIQCAQCHDHKTEKWTQNDFRNFAAASLYQVLITDKDAGMGGVKRVEVKSAARVMPRVSNMADAAPIAKAHPRALDGTDLEHREGTRGALAQWMTKDDNPWFARAFVNRMWGHFMGRGFVDPVDDMRPSNPVVAGDMLDLLAKDFVASGYDVKHLLGVITSVKAYGLAADASAKTDADNRLWGKFRLAPLGPEELLNAIFAASGIEEAAMSAGVNRLPVLRAQLLKQFAFLFDVDEELDARDYSGTVTQALTLMNGNLIGFGAKALPSSAVAAALQTGESEEAHIDALYMRVLGRPARPDERSRWATYVSSAVTPARSTVGQRPRAPRGKGGKDPLGRIPTPKKAPPTDPKTAAYEDVMWALLNSSEFAFNH